MNENQRKVLARFVATILGNFSVIGFGLAIYQQEWSNMIMALVTAKMGAAILWRSEQND